MAVASSGKTHDVMPRYSINAYARPVRSTAQPARNASGPIFRSAVHASRRTSRSGSDAASSASGSARGPTRASATAASARTHHSGSRSAAASAASPTPAFPSAITAA